MRARGKGSSPGKVEGSSRAMLVTARPSCFPILWGNLVRFGLAAQEFTRLERTYENGELSKIGIYHLHSLHWYSLSNSNITRLICALTEMTIQLQCVKNLVTFGPIIPDYEARMCTACVPVAWGLVKALNRSIFFLFQYFFLGGDIALLGGLHNRLSHTF